MEMKEVLIRTWEKMNCKETIRKYDISASCGIWGDYTVYTLSYNISRPTKTNPDASKFNTIRFMCSRERGMGFSDNMCSKLINYPCTEDEAIEIEYIFHQIKNKLEEMKRDELLEILQS